MIIIQKSSDSVNLSIERLLTIFFFFLVVQLKLASDYSNTERKTLLSPELSLAGIDKARKSEAGAGSQRAEWQSPGPELRLICFPFCTGAEPRSVHIEKQFLKFQEK